MCKVIVHGIIALLAFVDATKQHCDNDQLQRCMASLQNHNDTKGTTVSLGLTKDELDNVCIELNIGIRCVENYTNTCMHQRERQVFLSVYTDLLNLIQAVCTSGPFQEEYLNHSACFKTIQTEYEECRNKHDATLSAVNKNINETSVNLTRTVCCSFREYLTCSEQIVQLSCGDDAALFMSSFLNKMSANIIKSFCLEYGGQECSLNKQVAQNNSLIIVDHEDKV